MRGKGTATKTRFDYAHACTHIAVMDEKGCILRVDDRGMTLHKDCVLSERRRKYTVLISSL
jgi:hypothetical protein